MGGSKMQTPWRINVSLVILAVLSWICFSGCSESPTEPEDDGVDIDVDAELVSANTAFGFKVFAELAEEDAGKNIFISPSSIAFALAMVYNGASGETQQAMADTLELQEMSLERVNNANAALIATLENPSKHVDISIANSVWMREGYAFNQDFLQRNADFYGAEATSLDFGSPSAPVVINDWVSRETHGKIDRIVDNLNADTTLILINALYFQGFWTVKFEREMTREGMFTLLDGSRKKVKMMVSESNRYSRYYGKDFEAVSLPYGGGRVSMYIFLPDEESSLEDFCRNLDVYNWETWMHSFHSEEVEVHLPRFTLEYEADLNDVLKAIGMEVAFEPGEADFAGICPRDIWIGRVRHKTFLEVNEEGTVAAAATSVEMNECAPMPFIVDRPFFCAIRDNDTGTILFMGSIVDP
jgi:serpin B